MSLDTVDSENGIRSKWGWFVALGVVLLVLGILALRNLFLATFASVYFIGTLMLVAGILQIGHAIEVKRWGGFFYWLLSGLLYGAAGFLAFYNPALAAVVLTLILAGALIASGILRIVASMQRREGGWGWLLASGVITILAGLVLAFTWPVNSLWTLGLVLAIDLTFQGVAAIGLGVALKSGSRSAAESAQLRHT